MIHDIYFDMNMDQRMVGLVVCFVCWESEREAQLTPVDLLYLF